MTTKQKLLKLADFLEHKVKTRWFNLTTWSTPGFPEKECGTTACAAGWATVCFPRSGLSLVPNRYDDSRMEIRYKRTQSSFFRGSEAVKEFFGIDFVTARYLFDPSQYQEHANRQLENMMKFMMNKFGFEYIPGTDRVMIQCKSCHVYELASQLEVNEKGLFEVVEEGMSVDDLEKAGWRKINDKWECPDCLAAGSSPVGAIRRQ